MNCDSSVFEDYDGPAKAILEKNRTARLARHAKETQEELTEISTRVATTLEDYTRLKTPVTFESVKKKISKDNNDSTLEATLEFVDDVSQLLNIIADPVTKRKYQQHVTIFIVGYENLCGDRLELLSQINESLYSYNEDYVPDISDCDFDVDATGRMVRNTIEKAVSLQTRLQGVSKNVSAALNKLNIERIKHSKRKSEKELASTREHVLSITEKLNTAQDEILQVNERIGVAYRNLEAKQIEIERLKAQLDASKKKIQDNDILQDIIKDKDTEMTKLLKEMDQLNMKSEGYKEKMELEIEKWNKLREKHMKIENDQEAQVRFLQEQIMNTKRETEGQCEKKLNELQHQMQEKLDEQSLISKKKISSMNATIQKLKTDLVKVEKDKEAAINKVLTDQVLKERSEREQAFENSVERVVKYEKELKASQEKNRELIGKITAEEEEKKLKVKKREKKKSRDERKSSFNSIGLQVEIEPDEKPPLIQEVIRTETVYINDENEKEKNLELKAELNEVKNKFNQKITLVTKLMEESKKFGKERDHLMEQIAIANNIKDGVEKQLQAALENLEIVRTEFTKANTEREEAKKIIGKKEAIKEESVEEQPAVEPPEEPKSTIDEDLQQEVRSSVSRPASSVSSETKYKVLEACLRNHPMVLNIRESYASILSLRDEVIAMLKVEQETDKMTSEDASVPGGTYEDYKRIVEQIPLEDTEASDAGDVTNQILKMAVNSTRILTTLQQVIPVLVEKEDEILYYASNRTTPFNIDAANDANNIERRSANNRSAIQLPPIGNNRQSTAATQRSSGQTRELHNTTTNIGGLGLSVIGSNRSQSSRGRLAEDYKALMFKHNDLEQDFLKLKKQYESSHRVHENILSSNATTMQDMEYTIAQLKHQLKEALDAASKQEEYVFTRVDAEHNERILLQSVRQKKLDVGSMDEISSTMKEYNKISIGRWADFARRYLHQHRMEKLKTMLDSPQYHIKKLIAQLNELHMQRGRQYQIKSAQLSHERIRLANILIKRLETIENETGCFLIKPIQTIRPDCDVRPCDRIRFPPSKKTNPSILSSSKTFSSMLKGVSQLEDEGNVATWNPFNTLPKPNNHPDTGQPHIPRLLELDINRAMYRENLVTASTAPLKSLPKNKDCQLDLVSYMTVERPTGVQSDNLDQNYDAGTDTESVTSGIKRPTSLPALKSRLAMVTEETLVDHYRRSVSTLCFDGGRKVTLSPMV